MTALLDVQNLVVEFPGRRRAEPFRAVKGITFHVRAGHALGIVGESGCGKSTTAQALIGLVPAHSGQIFFGGRDIASVRRDAPLRGRIQMVFQDPAGALNPRMRIRDILGEIVHATDSAAGAGDIQIRVESLMQMVELPAELLQRFPQSLSGGQRQRVSIARALASRPDLLILDEAIAALDVSVQAAIVALVARLKDELGVAVVFISHNLGAVRGLCENVMVMYGGEVVEQGATESVFNDPQQEYTQRLLAAEPVIPG